VNDFSRLLTFILVDISIEDAEDAEEVMLPCRITDQHISPFSPTGDSTPSEFMICKGTVTAGFPISLGE
jgi:hypothetical protein